MSNKALITIAAVIFAVLSVVPASARIVGFSGPTKVLHPGERFHVTFHTGDWPINVEEYYAVFGITPQPTAGGNLGILLGHGYDLVAHGHSISGFGSFDVSLQIPKDLPPPLASHKTTKYLLTSVVLIAVCANLGLPEELRTYIIAITIHAGWCGQRGVDRRLQP